MVLGLTTGVGKQDFVCIPGIVSLVGGITMSPGCEAKCHLGRPTISLRRASIDTIHTIQKVDTVSMLIEPWGSIFQNMFLDGVLLKFMCAFLSKFVHFYHT